MATQEQLACDGCGQSASAEHIARRFKRLEEATRFRPLHILWLFLGAIMPSREEEYLYAASQMDFEGEAATVLKRAGIGTEGRTRQEVLMEFQRGGYFLTHALPCPQDEAGDAKGLEMLVRERIPVLATRLKRSLRPKRVVFLSAEFAALGEPLRKSMPEVEWIREDTAAGRI